MKIDNRPRKTMRFFTIFHWSTCARARPAGGKQRRGQMTKGNYVFSCLDFYLGMSARQLSAGHADDVGLC